MSETLTFHPRGHGTDTDRGAGPFDHGAAPAGRCSSSATPRHRLQQPLAVLARRHDVVPGGGGRSGGGEAAGPSRPLAARRCRDRRGEGWSFFDAPTRRAYEERAKEREQSGENLPPPLADAVHVGPATTTWRRSLRCSGPGRGGDPRDRRPGAGPGRGAFARSVSSRSRCTPTRRRSRSASTSRCGRPGRSRRLSLGASTPRRSRRRRDAAPRHDARAAGGRRARSSIRRWPITHPSPRLPDLTLSVAAQGASPALDAGASTEVPRPCRRKDRARPSQRRRGPEPRCLRTCQLLCASLLGLSSRFRPLTALVRRRRTRAPGRRRRRRRSSTRSPSNASPRYGLRRRRRAEQAGPPSSPSPDASARTSNTPASDALDLTSES